MNAYGQKGGSIRVYVQFVGGKRQIDDSVAELIALEESKGLYQTEIYQRFSEQIQQISMSILSAIHNNKNKELTEVAVYGSSVGCVSLINQFNLGKVVNFIVDDNPFKNELIGPGYRLEVTDADELVKRKPKLTIILAWRYAKSICEKNREYLQAGGEFLIPLPEVTYTTMANSRTNSLVQ